jgi:hypothetical protein
MDYVKKYFVIFILFNINSIMGQKLVIDKEIIGKDVQEYYPEYLAKNTLFSFKYEAKDSCELYFYDEKIKKLSIEVQEGKIQSVSLAIEKSLQYLINQIRQEYGEPFTGIHEVPQTNDRKGEINFGRKRLNKRDYDEKQINNYSIIVWKDKNIMVYLFAPYTLFNPENYLVLKISNTPK